MQEGQTQKTVKGLIWSFGERISAQLVSTIVTIVLARLLTPEHYGIISIVTVLITFLNVFVTGGFSTALVQKKTADSCDFNTTFWLSLVASVVLYAALFFCAPLVAAFYEMPLLTSVIRVMGLRLPISAVNSIQQAEIQRKMEFRSFFWATLVGTLLSGVLGVGMAIGGAGVWALVAQYLTNVTIDTIALFIIGRWRPGLEFSMERLKAIAPYGTKVLVTQLAYTLEADVRSLVVGKVFGSEDLAYYDQGKKYPALLVGNITATIDKVMLPAYSKMQDEREQLLLMLRRSIKMGVYLLAPILLGFAAVADSFVEVLLTEKWMPCVPYIQIFCLSYLTRPMESSCHQALLAIGKSGVVLAIMVLLSVFGVVSVLFSVFILKSVFAIAVFSLITTLLSLFVFSVSIRRYFHYSFRQQLLDVLPSVLLSAAMYVAVVIWGLVQINMLLRLLLQVATGIGVYVILSVIFKPEPFVYLSGFIVRFVKKGAGEKENESNE